MQRRYPCGRRAANRLLGLLLGICVLSILPVWAQGQSTKPAKSAATDKRSAATAPRKPPVPPPPPLPQTIRVGSTEMPLTDVVPNTEAALSRLQQTLDKTKDPTLLRLRQAIDAFSAKTKKSRDETVYLVQNARSAEQLSETRLVWWKDQQELDNLNSSLQSYIQVLTEEQRQVSQIQREWLLAAPPPEEGILPPGLLDRIQQVQQTAATADAAVRSTLDSLVQLQVRISDVRKLVDDIVQQTDNAERRLHASILVLDGPPIWSAMRGSSYARLREQARITVIAVRSRTLNFYSSRRYALVGYLVVLFALTAVFFRLRGYQQRQQPPGQEASLASRSLQNPFSLAAFALLFLFGVFFPNAPPEVIRFSQFLLIFPMLRIALTVFDRPLRWPVIALAIFYALDGMTSHMTAGTLFRRLLVLVLTVAGLMVVAWVSLARSRVPALFARRGWTMAGVFVRFAAICLAASGMCNIVGSVSLADLLLHGTLQSIWWAMAVYLMYLVLGALIAVLSMTQLGQISRLVRLHRERVLARVDTMLKLASWTVWVGGLLFAYQIARYTFAGFRSALNYKWSIGAVTFTIREVFLFFLVLLVASSVAKAVRFFLEEELLPHTPLRPGVAQACSRLTHYALALIGFYLAMAAAGMNLGRATLLTGAFGVGLGFGLQGLVSNFVSGIIISLERPMQVGDVIEVGHLLGKVTTIGFRSSTIRTADGAEVIVPNSELTTKSFVNWSLTDQLRRGELRVGVAYGTEPSRVLEILARVAGAHPAVVKHPSPSAGFERFGESALEFFLRFWTDVEKLDSVRSDLNVLVAEELGKSRITVALPQRDVHLHMSEASSETNGRLPEKSGFSAKEAEYLITK